MRRIIFRAALIALWIATAAPSGGLAAAGLPGEAPPAQAPPAEESDSRSREAEIARARETLMDLLASEHIERIDFAAETYDQAMAYIRAAVDAILEPLLADSPDITMLVHHASQVIEAFDSHTPRGLTMTFGKNVKRIPITDPGEARMVGTLVGNTVSLIRKQFADPKVSYRDTATNLFRSVILDVEEGPYLVQYLEGIQRIADLPSASRGRYFH